MAPSNPANAHALMLAAIAADNPVVFLEHMALCHAGRAEGIDLRTICPLDADTILTLVRRTGRALVLFEAEHPDHPPMTWPP